MNSAIKQNTRYGAYGVILRGSTILLTKKISGPYKGLWDLPGGGIEFGESPEGALKRELLEETAMAAGSLELLHIGTSNFDYLYEGVPHAFHHIGIIYKVANATPMPHLVPEEEMRWVEPSEIKKEELTPFANYAISAVMPTLEGSWRPHTNIRGKVIAIMKHKTHNRLLVCEVRDDQDVLKGWCPLGGGIDFGETGEEAIKREMQEELGCEIQIKGSPITFENIFEHHGMKGHEIILAFNVTLENPQLYENQRFQIYEDRGSVHWVEWIDIERFQSGESTLFPQALVEKLLLGSGRVL